LLQGLESGDIKITGEREYFIEPGFAQILNTAHQNQESQAKQEIIQAKRKWWKFG